MTQKWQRNDKEMTKKWQKMTTQIQNDKPKCKKKCNKNEKKWQNNYFGISNVCRPKIFLSLTHLLGEIGNGTPTVHMACFNVQKKTAKLGSWSSILGFYPGFTMFTPITTPFGPRWKDYILNRDDSGVVGELWRWNPVGFRHHFTRVENQFRYQTLVITIMDI